ncbi:hypothetical protein M436DRAFT_62635 [Aureobasidium namibiae CBS 147.97]|uniref:Uncharacterized protein n=1 Tax=Aureobasidium namibiae CBS 147.97 TaxID=1043004 RepID=A0A074XI19_9PEZI
MAPSESDTPAKPTHQATTNMISDGADAGAQVDAKAGSTSDAEWSTLTIGEKIAAINARNKAFADARKAKPESKTTAEPGPIDENDRGTFKMLDERMAALKLQVEALKKDSSEMRDDAGKPDDSGDQV